MNQMDSLVKLTMYKRTTFVQLQKNFEFILQTSAKSQLKYSSLFVMAVHVQ